MLAQNFKTPVDLGIPDVEFESLVKVLGMLERGEITKKHFLMSQFWSDCGTFGCLCGWANHISDGRAFPEVVPPYSASVTEGGLRKRLPAGLLALFAADGVTTAGDATPEHGAIALRNYLTTGKANWPEVLAE